MIARLISFATGKALPYIIAAVAVASFYGGYEWKSGQVAQDEVDQLIAIQEKLELERNRNAHIATLYAQEKQNRKVITREKVREVVKYVDVDNCTLTDNGLSKLRCQLNPTTCAAKLANRSE